jgi:hypothetical protein
MKSGFQSNEPIVFEKSGGAALSWDDLRKQLPTSNKQESNVSHFLRLSNHVLRIQGMDIDIEGIDYVYDVNVETLTHVIRGKLLAKAIVKDVASGNLTFIDKKGRVKEPRG